MSCNTTENPLEDILKSDSPKIKTITDHLADHEVQVIYTQIDRDKNGLPIFKEFSFQLNKNNYFYPASTAKLPVAILALQRIKELQAEGSNITKESPFEIFDPETNEVILMGDSTEENGKATVAHMIKKIFLVSDNEAYNYLFEFLGRDYINESLRNR
uniref:serine hydrolase n=1 Tax=Roseivirga sp. TaxID=1964215 RepID=UPI00404746A7